MERAPFRFAVLYIVAFFLAALFVIWIITSMFAGAAQAHGWYDRACCMDKDCHPVPCDDIRGDAKGGFIWHRGPNDDVFFLKERLKVSQDGACHVCVASGVSPAGICIYLPWSS